MTALYSKGSLVQNIKTVLHSDLSFCILKVLLHLTDQILLPSGFVTSVVVKNSQTLGTERGATKLGESWKHRIEGEDR